MRYQRGRLVSGVAVAVVMHALGCASAPREVDLPPQTLTEAPTSTVEQEAALASPAASDIDTDEASAPHVEQTGLVDSAAATEDPAESERVGRGQTIVIRSGTASEVTPRTLQQASQSERDRRAAAETPVVTITNSNLAELAEGGQLTIVGAGEEGAAGATAAGGSTTATPGPAAAASSNAGATTPTAGTGGAASGGAPAAPMEEYWRGQALKLRLDWKAAVESVDELQSEVQELRRRFYEEDDPFYRDNQIKPVWDRTLDLLAAARKDAEEQERRLSLFLEDGRRAGALPGWLREGVEFEPPPTADRTPEERRRSDDPWEPKVLREEAVDP